MMPILEIVVPALGAAALALYLLLPAQSKHKAVDGPSSESLEGLRATHYQYFPLIRQGLSDVDAQYLRQNVAPEIARQALRERRLVARKFLAGLHEDFSKLDRLSRMIASLAPSLDRSQEIERFRLAVKFKLVYALVWTVLRTGTVPMGHFEQLAALIGRLSDQMDQAIASVNGLSTEPVGLSSR